MELGFGLGLVIPQDLELALYLVIESNGTLGELRYHTRPAAAEEALDLEEAGLAARRAHQAVGRRAPAQVGVHVQPGRRDLGTQGCRLGHTHSCRVEHTWFQAGDTHGCRMDTEPQAGNGRLH